MKDGVLNSPLPVPATKSPYIPRRYFFAVIVTLIAFGIRWSLEPMYAHSNTKHVFTFFIVATIIVAWYGGFVPSLITFGLGFLLGDWFFLEPTHSLRINPGDYFQVILPPALISLIIILFGRSMHLARDKANASASTAIANQKMLELEVHERKQAEEEVRRLNSELEQRVQQRTAELITSNQELESFTYSVSHDLRAPLRHVDGYAQILEEEFSHELSPEAQKFAKKIRQGSQNMGRLVDDLLNLSRVGKAELKRQTIATKTMVEEVIAEIKLEEASRVVEWKIGPLATLDGDPGLVRQVFINLLANAFKYTRPVQHAVVEVGSRRDKNETVFYVKDNGVGFSMKYSGKLFGVFQRLHRAEEFEGTGVGLAIVARIVRKHGGRIWAEAEVGKGATFFFTISPAAV